MRKKRALFLANDLGGGLGHVRRALQIARLLFRRGWEVGVVYHREKTAQHLPPGFRAFYLPVRHERWLIALRARLAPIHYFPLNLEKPPYFWEFHSLNYQVLRDGYFTPGIVSRRFQALQKTVRSWKPDLLVGDGHLLSFLLSRSEGLPLVQIVRYFVFPEAPHFIWWKETPPELVAPKSLRAFDSLLEKLGLDSPDEACGLLRGDGYLIPGNSQMEPIESAAPHLFYGYHVNSDYNPRMLGKDPKTHPRKIYVTVGGGAMKLQVARYYRFLLEVFRDLPFQIIFSDPWEVLLPRLREETLPHLRAFKWIESSTIFPNLDLIIHHGGYGTTLESLWWGVPSLVVPFHTEQEGNARRLERLQLGKVLPIAREPYRPVEFRSYYGRFTMRGGFRFGLESEQFKQTLLNLMNDSASRERVKQFSNRLRDQYDPVKIVRFLEQFVR